MRDRLALCLFFLAFIAACGNDADVTDDPLSHLDFEECGRSGSVSPWSGGPPPTLDLDGHIVRSGNYAGRIVRDTASPGGFSTFTTTVPADVVGKRLELVGWLRTEDVEGFAGLWLREDGPGGVVQFDNMQQRGLSGTNDWTRCRIELPLDGQAEQIFLGALLSGTGQLWVDDVELLVDGKPYARASKREPILTVLDHDTEFDDGSGLTIDAVAPWRVDSLVLLGKVWGFLKYHHPQIAAGERHWDYDLLRVLRALLAAPDAAAARRAVSDWALAVGEPVPTTRFTGSPAPDGHLEPDLAWLDDTGRLGRDLAAYLRRVHAGRPSGPQFYVGVNPGAGNPDFLHEDRYDHFSTPDAGFRLLALFRFWNIINYWFPYRDVIGEDWDAVLAEFVPQFLAADGEVAYDRALLSLVARVNDTHANLWSHLDSRPPRGAAQLPVDVRFIADQAVIWRYTHSQLGPASGLEIGDVITAMDGAPVDSLRAAWSPYYAASNEPTRLRDIGRQLTVGNEGPCRVTIERAGARLEVNVDRVLSSDLETHRHHDREGPVLQLLDDDIAYLKLSAVQAADCPDYIDRAAGARGLVIDIRNYPSEFVPFALGGHLVSERMPFVCFTNADLANPGAFAWLAPLFIEPLDPYFAGHVAILVDETTQSQAEYTAMALRTASDVVVIGSTTAGADGNVSAIPLPGGRRSMISGIGIFYPDRSPTQRVGIVPDIEVIPTVAGIRAGRDEVLEAAVNHILGR